MPRLTNIAWALAFAIGLAALPSFAQEPRTFEISSTAIDREVFAGHATDVINSKEDYGMAALAEIVRQIYKSPGPKPAPREVLQAVNEARERYEAQERLAKSSSAYQYRNKSDMDKVHGVFDIASGIPVLAPFAKAGQKGFDLYVERRTQQLAPGAQVDAQIASFELYSKLRDGQTLTWRDLAELGAADPSGAGFVINQAFAQYLGAKYDDKASDIIGRNKSLRQEHMIKQLVSAVGTNGKLQTSIKDLTAIYKVGMTELLKINIENHKMMIEEQKRRRSDLTKEEQRASQKEMIDAATSGVYIVSTLVKLGGDPALARQMSVGGNGIISIVDAISKYSTRASSVSNAASAVILTGGILGGVMAIASLMSADSSSETAVLLQLDQIQRSITSLRRDMNYRFDLVDARLSSMMDVMVLNLQSLQVAAGRQSASLRSIQITLLDLHQQLDRLQEALFLYLVDLSQRMTNKSITFCLDFQRLYAPTPLDESEYRKCQADFLSWALNDSRDRLAAAPILSDVSEPLFSSEVRRYPMSSRINALTEYVGRVDTTFPKVTRPLSNPVVWQTGADAYIEMADAWPNYSARYPEEGLNRLIQTGLDLDFHLSHLTLVRAGSGVKANYELPRKLITSYNKQVDNLALLIGQRRSEFIQNEGKSLNFWADGNQATPYSPALLNQPIATSVGLLAVPAEMPAAIPRPVLIAEQLGLGSIVFKMEPALCCLMATRDWLFKGSPGELEVNVFHMNPQVTISVYFRIRERPAAEPVDKLVAKRVMRGTDNYKHIICRVPLKANPPLRDCSTWQQQTAQRMQEVVEGNWSANEGLRARFVKESEIVETEDAAKNIVAIRKLTETRLAELRNAMYLRIDDELSRATEIRRAAQLLNGHRDLIELYVTFGFPRSITTNERLHALIYGSQRLPDDADIRRLIVARSSTTTPLAEPAFADVRSFAVKRSRQLESEIRDVLREVEKAGQHESIPAVTNTVYRLRMRRTGTVQTEPQQR